MKDKIEQKIQKYRTLLLETISDLTSLKQKDDSLNNANSQTELLKKIIQLPELKAKAINYQEFILELEDLKKE